MSPPRGWMSSRPGPSSTLSGKAGRPAAACCFPAIICWKPTGCATGSRSLWTGKSAPWAPRRRCAAPWARRRWRTPLPRGWRGGPRGWPPVWFKIREVWRRELLDRVRDKRTLYMMVRLPIVRMPGIMLLGPVMAVRQQESLAGQVPVALVAGGDQLPGLMEWIKATGALAIETAPPGSGPEEWAQRLGAGEVQLVVELPPDARDRAAAEEPVTVRVVVAGGNPRSARAA